MKSVLRAAWKLDLKAGMARVKKLAEWPHREYPSATAGQVEGRFNETMGYRDLWTMEAILNPPQSVSAIAAV